MAPTDEKKTSKKFTAKDGNVRRSRNAPQDGQKKRKWVQQHKAFEGSVKEGQGFAFKRKEKVKHQYNKLLRKEKRNTRNPESRQVYVEEYPEHLKHLYLAEAEKLKKEAWTNRVNRTKQRMRWQTCDAAVEQEAAAEAQQTKAAEEEVTGGSEPADSLSGSHEPEPEPEPEPAEAKAKESLPISNRMKKKMEKKTSFQKTKEEFERIKEKRREKKEEYLKNQQQREKAIQKYKQKKTETFQMLSKKTKKGQPNLNLQMEYLLQKIQKN